MMKLFLQVLAMEYLLAPIRLIRALLLLLVLSSARTLPAQKIKSPPADTACPSWFYNDVVPERFNPGFHTAIFGNNVNIRQAPAATAPILDVLPIGQPVRVIASDTARLTLNGRTAHWHLVEWKSANSAPKQGWVWGGYLALAGGACPQEPMLMLGCTEVKKDKDARRNGFIHEIKAVKDAQLLDKLTLPMVHIGEAQIFYFSILSSKGLPGVQHVVHFDWSQATCGGVNTDFYALWTKNNRFQLLPVLQSTGESGYYSNIEQYIFPDETKNVQYQYPLMYLLEKPENKTAILYLKEESNGDENGAGVSISISKLKYTNNVWSK